MDLLDLPGWKTAARTQENGLDTREAVFVDETKACPECGVVGELYKHGTRTIEYADAPAYGVHTRLKAKLRRYRCRACSCTFMQPVTGVMDKPRMTERCFQFIQSQCLVQTFSNLAKQIGCDEKTIRNVASATVEAINSSYKPVMPEFLGIDETKLCGSYCAVFTDVGNNRPVDLLPTREPAAIATWLTRNSAAKHVKCVTTDMYPPYKKLVNELMPGVPVITDKFHVLKMVDFALETIRRRIANSRPAEVGRAWKRQSVLLRLRRHKVNEKGLLNLLMWLDNEPDLKAAYDLKESFYDIYDAPDRETAAGLLDAWMASVPPHLAKEPRKDFKAVLTATKNWRTEILNYFEHRITNGYTESLNGHTKRANRAGFGYTFPVLRARFLWPVFHQPKEDVMQAIHRQGATTFTVEQVFGGARIDYAALFKMRDDIYAENGGCCQVCGGHYEIQELAIPPDDPLLQCRMCFERTHAH